MWFKVDVLHRSWNVKLMGKKINCCLNILYLCGWTACKDWLFSLFFSPWTTIIHWNYCDCTLSTSHTTFHLNQNGQLPIKPVHFAPGFRECTQLQCDKGLMDANELALPFSRHVTPVWHCSSVTGCNGARRCKVAATSTDACGASKLSTLQQGSESSDVSPP